jgi:hypothetical protein
MLPMEFVAELVTRHAESGVEVCKRHAKDKDAFSVAFETIVVGVLETLEQRFAEADLFDAPGTDRVAAMAAMAVATGVVFQMVADAGKDG